MGKKDDKIRALKEEIVQYQYDIEFLEQRILTLTNQLSEKLEPDWNRKSDWMLWRR